MRQARGTWRWDQTREERGRAPAPSTPMATMMNGRLCDSTVNGQPQNMARPNAAAMANMMLAPAAAGRLHIRLTGSRLACVAQQPARTAVNELRIVTLGLGTGRLRRGARAALGTGYSVGEGDRRAPHESLIIRFATLRRCTPSVSGALVTPALRCVGVCGARTDR
jgi:hypothetical protein